MEWLYDIDNFTNGENILRSVYLKQAMKELEFFKNTLYRMHTINDISDLFYTVKPIEQGKYEVIGEHVILDIKETEKGIAVNVNNIKIKDCCDEYHNVTYEGLMIAACENYIFNTEHFAYDEWYVTSVKNYGKIIQNVFENMTSSPEYCYSEDGDDFTQDEFIEFESENVNLYEKYVIDGGSDTLEDFCNITFMGEFPLAFIEGYNYNIIKSINQCNDAFILD